MKTSGTNQHQLEYIGLYCHSYGILLQNAHFLCMRVGTLMISAGGISAATHKTIAAKARSYW